MKLPPRTAGAGIIPSELFSEFDLAALDEPAPALDVRLAGIALTPLGCGLRRERKRRLRDACVPCEPPVLRGRWVAWGRRAAPSVEGRGPVGVMGPVSPRLVVRRTRAPPADHHEALSLAMRRVGCIERSEMHHRATPTKGAFRSAQCTYPATTREASPPARADRSNEQNRN